MGPNPPNTKADVTEVTDGTSRAASASATGRPSAARSSSSHSPSQSGRQVEKLQQALVVMEDTGGVTVECLKTELEKTKKTSQKRPLNVEVDECRKFITRSEKRFADLDRVAWWRSSLNWPKTFLRWSI